MPVKNIVFIAVDDCIDFRLLRNMFGVPILTPNLDALAARSTVFDKAYSEIAVCSPSRWATMSGYSPFQTGHFNSEFMWEKGNLRPQDMWAYRLRQAGFYTRTGGKIYHGYGLQPAWVNAILYDEAVQITFGQGGADAPYVQYGGNKGFTDESRDGDFYDAKSATQAINFLNSRPVDGKPFYCEIGFHHPHTGWDTPVRFKEMYDWSAPRPPGTWENGFNAVDFGYNFLSANPVNPDDWDKQEWRDNICNYFSAISHVDYEVGRLLSALRASPHNDNTMIVFYSDHGYHLGDHGKFHKFTLWETAARAPLIIHVPGVAANTVTQPVSFMDIGQTVLDYAGQPLNPASPGISLRPYIETGNGPERWVPSFWYGSASATDGETRIVMYQDASVEFYDLAVDPFCAQNLGRSDPRYSAARDGLLAACQQHGYRLIEQGMAVSTAIGDASYMGFMGEVTSEKAQGSWTSINASTRGAESPGYRKQMISMTGSHPDVVMVPGADRLHVQATKGSNYRIQGYMGDKQIRLIALGGNATATVDLVGGNNYVFGEGHVLHLLGGSGNDTIEADNGDDWIDGGGGDDSISAGGGNDTVFGGGGNDYINGEGGNDLIDGGAGKDTLLGGDGRDTLIASGGDLLTGGSGNDTFVIKRSEQPNTITDLAAGDVLDLSDWAPIQPLTITQTGSSVQVTAGLEMLVCNNCTVATVRAAITGATYA